MAASHRVRIFPASLPFEVQLSLEGLDAAGVLASSPGACGFIKPLREPEGCFEAVRAAAHEHHDFHDAQAVI